MPTFPAVRVHCYAGYKGEERPLSFELKGKRITVEEILDQWVGTNHRYFKIRGSDRHLYILRYDIEKDQWEVEFTETTKRK